MNTGYRTTGVQPTTQGNLDSVTLSQQAPQRVTLESERTLAPIQVDVNPFDEKFYEVPPDSVFDISEEEGPLKPVSGSRETRSKMHQTSSRLLRMTEDDRPFTRVRTQNLVHLTWPSQIHWRRTNWLQGRARLTFFSRHTASFTLVNSHLLTYTQPQKYHSARQLQLSLPLASNCLKSEIKPV